MAERDYQKLCGDICEAYADAEFERGHELVKQVEREAVERVCTLFEQLGAQLSAEDSKRYRDGSGTVFHDGATANVRIHQLAKQIRAEAVPHDQQAHAAPTEGAAQVEGDPAARSLGGSDAQGQERAHGPHAHQEAQVSAGRAGQELTFVVVESEDQRRWHDYACAALASPHCGADGTVHLDQARNIANEMLKLEKERWEPSEEKCPQTGETLAECGCFACDPELAAERNKECAP